MPVTWRPEVLMNPGGATFAVLFFGSALKHLWLYQVRAARDKLFTLVGHVAELHVYPIKACGGTELQSATATVTGLSADGYSDRRWMVQSEAGQGLTMQKDPRLTLVTSTVEGDWLVVSAPDMTPLRLPKSPDPDNYQHVTVTVNDCEILALDCGTEANDWMSRFLGKPVRLVHSRPAIGSRDAYDTPMKWENEARKGDKTVFAWLTSYLLTTTASLSELNNRLDSQVSSRHFRPNIVVSTARPFDEDDWEEVRIGTTAKFHYVQPCVRCVITTINPQTAQRSATNQPLSMLRTYRKKTPYGSAPVFGAYIAIDCNGPISVGDPVYAIRRQSSTL